MNRLLVTTALEETWPADQPVLFLGEWCRRYSRRHRWSQMEAEVLPYHWDDREKLWSDYRYLQDFYARLLRDLAAHLNEIHGTTHDLRYWRILIGPWLGYFVQIVFDRWTSLQSAIAAGVGEAILLAGRDEDFVPQEMEAFIRAFMEDDWNEHLWGLIIREFTELKFTVREKATAARSNAPQAVGASWRRQSQRVIARFYSVAAGFLSKPCDAFFLSTYLPTRDEIRLHRRLGQVPQLWRSLPAPRVPCDLGKRTWTVAGTTGSAFEAMVRRLVVQQIPVLYLEGYRRLVAHVAAVPWPKRPRVIWTANNEIWDDVFKAWAAEKVGLGCPLIIGQHGGHYGIGLWSFTEEHQTAIADHYLSWGWQDGQSKVVPIGQLKAKRPLGLQHAKQPRALMVTAVHPRYSYWMYSTPVAGQWQDYFGDQFRFVDSLPLSIQAALTVRLYPQDFGWEQQARWRDRFPALRLDEGGASINTEIRRCRLYISTYNATTFLESFTMDVPTVIYWNPKHWELRESARPYFEELKRAGIFHETPEAAARQVAAIWHDVETWWQTPAVRNAVGRFKVQYCHLPDNLLDRVEQVLRNVMEEPTGARP